MYENLVHSLKVVGTVKRVLISMILQKHKYVFEKEKTDMINNVFAEVNVTYMLDERIIPVVRRRKVINGNICSALQEIVKSIVEKYKNITKTANTLFISQPALTARIKQIENELDVKLLQRSNKGVSFTSYGEYTAQFAIQHLKEFNNFKQNLHTFGKEVSGTLKIAVSSIIGRYYLPSLLESFHTAYPKIRFELTTIPSSEVNKLVKSHLVDFGFTKNASAFADNNKILLTTYNALIACTTPFSIEIFQK